MGIKIHTKSMRNQGCVADAHRERFWSVLGRFRDESLTRFAHPLETIFDQNPKKGSQKGIQKSGAKMGSKINEKASRFWNLRLLDFCREYNVKIVFLHDQGYQKSATNLSKVYANSMLEKVMQKT